MNNPRLAAALAWNGPLPGRKSEVSKLGHKKYMAARRIADPAFKTLCVLRSRLCSAVRAAGARKTSKTKDLLGCSIPEFKAHIERQFRPGMSWANHGEWHIDHIKPCADFDLLDPAQQRICFHWSNMQPLWAMDNFRKGDR